MKYANYFLASLLTSPSLSFAVQTVTFQGEVTNQTCNVSINGSTDSIVMLPSVALSEFGSTLAVGQTAGLTPFTVSVSDCASQSTAQAIGTKFLGYDVDASTGVLGNRATANAATGVGIQLTGNADGSEPVILSGSTTVSGLTLPANSTNATYEFGARYYLLDTSATAGAITAVAEYTLTYL